jgi:hypothetical protein
LTIFQGKETYFFNKKDGSAVFVDGSAVFVDGSAVFIVFLLIR